MQYNRTTKQRETLFFKNWIKAGFVFVKSLRFVDGVLDETYIYDKIIDKRNIYCEILTVKKALIPYRYMSVLIQCSSDFQNNSIDQTEPSSDTLTESLTSKLLYKCIICNKMTPPFQDKAWQRILDVHTIDFVNVYLHKIKLMADRKLAEFNFKVLHLILTCGLNLKRWGKDDWFVQNLQCYQ